MINTRTKEGGVCGQDDAIKVISGSPDKKQLFMWGWMSWLKSCFYDDMKKLPLSRITLPGEHEIEAEFGAGQGVGFQGLSST